MSVKIAGIHAQSQKKVAVMTVKKIAIVEQISIMRKLIVLSHGCAPTLRAVDVGRAVVREGGSNTAPRN